MKRLAIIGCMAAGLCAFGAPTMGEDDGKYVIDVPAGETYALTADDVAAIGTLPLVKAGEGTLTVNDVLKDYTGDIYVTNGIYRADTAGAVGTTNGVTRVLDGGTFNGTREVPSSGGLAFAGGERFYICGEGYNRLGAIRQTSKACCRFGGKTTLTGPTRISGTSRLDYRYDGFDMAGYQLTAAMEGGQCLFLVGVSVAHPGNIVVERGSFEFQAGVSGFTAAQTVTVKSGAALSQWNSTQKQQATLVLEDGARLTSNNGTYAPGKYEKNVWEGPITVQGGTVNALTSGNQVTFVGKISGAGGFRGGSGGWLQFYNAANTFTDGIGQTSGGVAAWNTNSIPVQGGAVALTNASLHLMKSPPYTMTLPDLAFHGTGVVSGKLASVSAKSLTKTGSGMLDLWTPLQVTGPLAVQNGGIRIRTRVPDTPGGLHWYQKDVTGNINAITVPPTIPYMGIDQAGVSFAYRAWPAVPTFNTCYYYTGYIRVPGEEGETVTLNCISSIARTTHLRIGDTDVIKFNDQADLIDNENLAANDWSRFRMGRQRTLTAGWHPLFLEMHNWHDTTRGPQPNTGKGWQANFGIGIDWQGRCVTNPVYYAKLVDPGDGSFLRPAMTKEEVDPAAYRPAFDGPATFGPGTSIDFGDAAPYVPFVFNGLSGCPAIANGELVVSNSWTVSHAQATAQPLTVAAGAKLTFAAGTTLAIEDIDLFSRKPAGTPLVVAADADAITGLPELIGVNHKWKVEASGDGKSLVLRDISGMVLTIR